MAMADVYTPGRTPAEIEANIAFSKMAHTVSGGRRAVYLGTSPVKEAVPVAWTPVDLTQGPDTLFEAQKVATLHTWGR